MRSQIPDINLILENGFVNMREDVARPEGPLPYWFTGKFSSILFRGDETESGFNIETIWEKAPRSSLGKIVEINAENDQRLSQTVPQKLVALAKRTPTTSPRAFCFLHCWTQRSYVTSRLPAHDSWPLWFATPSMYGSYIRCSLPILIGAFSGLAFGTFG